MIVSCSILLIGNDNYIAANKDKVAAFVSLLCRSHPLDKY